jgi:t-SNARE complex subunit (syntaxin)
MQTVQIKDAQLVRDIHSKAVLNTDRKGLDEYLMKKEIAKKQLEEQKETKLKLAKLEEEMSEIKSLLQEIANMRKV